VAGIRRFGCYSGAGESTLRMNSTFENKLSQIYWNRFQQFGSTPQGSFWATEARQTRRFEIILCEIDKLSGAAWFSLADIGCGYGALVDYLLKRPASSVTSYIGYDISEQLIAACKRKFEQPWARFICSSAPDQEQDFSVMSGPFNLAATRDLVLWQNYVFDTLQGCWSHTKVAMIFNLQVASSARISPQSHIYYANSDQVLEHCVARFGPTKRLVHPDLPRDATFVVLKPL